MAQAYNLSLIFYPQKAGGYTVICPELAFAVSEGETIDEATENIHNIIADFLTDKINASAEDEKALREGLCMKGKIFQEIEAEVTASGAVVFHSEYSAEALTKTA